jgi:predicted dienelactone hydrolase
VAFCEAHPDDGVCRPQREFAVDPTQTRTFLARPDMAAQIVRSHKDLSLLGVKAAFVMSPAIVQSFTPESLKRIAVPVAVVLGDADTVAPPLTNGEVAASLIPGSQIQILPGVGHYDFLSDCTPDGDTYVPVCPTRLPRDPTHQVAINNALALFGRTIGPP